MQMFLLVFPPLPRKGVLFVKEYMNSSELSASPRYGRYESVHTQSRLNICVQSNSVRLCQLTHTEQAHS